VSFNKELLPKWLWDFLILAIPLIGLVMVLLPYMLPAKKELSYEILSESRIVDLDAPPVKGLAASYHGAPLSKLSSLLIRIVNTGKIPIDTDSFDTDLWIPFGENAKVLHFNVTNRSPDNLVPDAVFDEGNLVIKPLFLNPGDEFTVNLFVAGEYETPILEGKIGGVDAFNHLAREMRFMTVPKSSLTYLGAGTSFFLLTFVYGYLAGLMTSGRRYPDRRLVIPKLRYLIIILVITCFAVSAPAWVFFQLAEVGRSFKEVLLVVSFGIVPGAVLGYRKPS